MTERRPIQEQHDSLDKVVDTLRADHDLLVTQVDELPDKIVKAVAANITTEMAYHEDKRHHTPMPVIHRKDGSVLPPQEAFDATLAGVARVGPLEKKVDAIIIAIEGTSMMRLDGSRGVHQGGMKQALEALTNGGAKSTLKLTAAQATALGVGVGSALAAAIKVFVG